MRGRWSVTHSRTSIDPMNFVYNCTSNTLIMHQKQYKYTQWGRRRYIRWKQNLRKKNNRLNACLYYEGHKWMILKLDNNAHASAMRAQWHILFPVFNTWSESSSYKVLVPNSPKTCDLLGKHSIENIGFFPYFDFALKIIIFEYFRLSCNRRLCTYENQVN